MGDASLPGPAVASPESGCAELRNSTTTRMGEGNGDEGRLSVGETSTRGIIGTAAWAARRACLAASILARFSSTGRSTLAEPSTGGASGGLLLSLEGGRISLGAPAETGCVTSGEAVDWPPQRFGQALTAPRRPWRPGDDSIPWQRFSVSRFLLYSELPIGHRAGERLELREGLLACDQSTGGTTGHKRWPNFERSFQMRGKFFHGRHRKNQWASHQWLKNSLGFCSTCATQCAVDSKERQSRLRVGPRCEMHRAATDTLDPAVFRVRG